MDLLINYPEFEQDIKDAFRELTIEFALTFLKLSDSSYLLKGEKCNIRFNYDRGDVFCDFKQPHEDFSKPGYGIFEILNFLNPDEITERVYDPRLQLFEYSRVIKLRLNNVLNGDFSWLRGLSMLNKTISFVLKNFNYHNPIRVKMRAGDETWKIDIGNYLNENKIIL